MRPLIGVTTDFRDRTAESGRYQVSTGYAQMIHDAGGTPVMLACLPELVDVYVDRLDGLVFTGGLDPDMADFGVAMHPKARKMDPARQRFELAMFDAIERQRPDMPVLGVCLGMQLLTLKAGGTLDQHLADHLDTHEDHREKQHHAVQVVVDDPRWGRAGDETVIYSHHQQAIRDASDLRVTVRAPDGVIEAVDDPARPFRVGVQWHPEKAPAESREATLNLGLFRRLIAAAAPAPGR
ncbi:MAG: gamma-glutamyl-gamma-aminobutyrate hydrolase family protein [Planctomycetota bacterium]